MKKIFLTLLVLTSCMTAKAESPASQCRRSIERYTFVPTAFFSECRRANYYSAQAVDYFTQVYSGSMSNDMLETLLEIDSQDEAQCAMDLAYRYNGYMGAEFLRRSCL